RLQASREVSLRLIGDWTRVVIPSEVTQRAILSFLTSYVLSPGSALYAGFDTTLDKKGGIWGRTSRSFYLKLSYLIQN
ncbi:MAG: hypothetical protein HY399_06885, partial [Elusimicrobia bacterium]|nr:hypothetical protein [Elusimicrobiota bacterium]